MKLLVVTCLKEYLKDVSKLFKQSNIDVFSTSEITGHRDSAPSSLLEDWFASGGEDVNAMMIFTVISEQNAEQGIKLIENYNKTIEGNFPIRAFIMPVEKFI
ncbi:hypothetical protein [Mucilaginibacter sp. UR6-11]|uniref:hypothetical protein n=1 Tax=Mucilaginibacter sp. UR6-11 TaxID=1435644 RepID=UPI001E65B4A3|nr:hypothetical protein [Mucilaginibacter sp. UR6-11]MCC8427208.1 hypothetical protein [Mucilaginibacter sp. UR6-11]